MKKILILTLILTSLPLWACWRMEGKITVNGKEISLNQKILHDKPYSFQNDKMIVNIKMPSKFDLPKEIAGQKNFHMVKIEFIEKDGIKMREPSRGEMIVKTNSPAVMTIGDRESKELTIVEIKIQNI